MLHFVTLPLMKYVKTITPAYRRNIFVMVQPTARMVLMKQTVVQPTHLLLLYVILLGVCCLTVSVPKMMVLVTFEDSINDENIDFYKQIFSGKYLNPNNCPIAATFFVSHQYNNYFFTQKLWNHGHEIAVHSISHKLPEEWWAENATIEDWFDEMVGQANILNKFSTVRLTEIKGLRAPFLRIGWNRQYLMMNEFGFLYDSSMVAPFSYVPLWPYTLDYKIPHQYVVLSKPDVWFVTNSQAIEWMQHPTPLKKLLKFHPWDCRKHVKQAREIACQTPNNCQLASRALKQDVELQTCNKCPKKYPWVKNEFGAN
ncbi:hypothetical protein D910_08634 [Dendroctonus ponderosae]|uniref:NodB homology domain-containing protein n=1 Tax=Dendroctonus ponderosae TaxID=77166 RepID=U4UMB7_DENPD|nr:hypothetical protein D910_08634 [Dendroctonus ponderosae]